MVHCSVAKLCPTLCNPMNCSMPGFLALHCLLEFAQTPVHWVGYAIQPSHPLSSPLVLPSIFPSTRVFSSESAIYIRWPKYWSFSFSFSPSNEYLGLISFRIDYVDLLADKDFQESSPAPQFKSINSLVLNLLYGLPLTSIHDYWKNHSFDYTDFVGKVVSDVPTFLFLKFSSVLLMSRAASSLWICPFPNTK